MPSDVPFPEQLRRANDFAQTLVGLSVAIATALAEEHGFLVRRVGPNYDQFMTADLRSNRITLDCSVDDIVVTAAAG
jgi:hypothetical protein